MICSCWGSKSFSQELFPVYKNNRCGYINNQGKLIVPHLFLSVEPVSEFEHGIVLSDSGQQIIHHTGKVEKEIYDSIWHYGASYLASSNDRNYYITIKNTKAHTIIEADSLVPFRFDEVDYIQVHQNGLTYLIDSLDKTYLKSLKAERLTILDNHHIQVYRGDKTGIYEIGGAPYLPLDNDSIQYYSGGLYFYQSGKLGYKRTLPYVNPRTKKHETIYFPAIYNSIKYYGKEFMVLQKEGKYLLYDFEKSKMVTTDFFDKAMPFDYYFHIYREGSNLGLLDRTGNILSEAKYQKLFSSGHPNRVFYVRDFKFGLLDENGTELTEPIFDVLHPFEARGISPRNFTKYEINKKFGLVNMDGDTLTDPKYMMIKLVSDNKAACVRMDSSARTFIIDEKTGQIDDWYDVLHMKQIEFTKRVHRVGHNNLRSYIIPSIDEQHHSYGIVNLSGSKKIRFNDVDHYQLYEKDIDHSRIFYSHRLRENTYPPLDVAQSLISVDNNYSFNRDYNKINYSKYYDDIRLIRNHFFVVKNDDEEPEYLDLHLQPLKYKIKLNSQSPERVFTITGFEPGNKYYQLVYKSTKNLSETIYLVPKRKFNGFYTDPIYDSIILLDKTILGRTNNTWVFAKPDSLKLPDLTKEIKVGAGVIITKHYNPTYYIYGNNGQLRDQPKSFEIIDQSEGFVLVLLDSVYNYICRDGRYLLDSNVRKATAFNNGFANIETSDGYHVINKLGQITSNITYSKPVLYNEFGIGIYYQDGLYGLIDSNNLIIDSAKYTRLQQISRSDCFQYQIDKGGDFGIISEEGKIITEPSYQRITTLNEHTFLVQTMKGKGIVNNTNGSEILAPKYLQVKDAKHGYYTIYKKGKWGMIDSLGNWTVPAKQFKITSFNSSGYATITSKKGTSYITTSGITTTERPKYMKATEVQQTNEDIIYNQNGEYIGLATSNIPAKYHKVTALNNGAFITERTYHFTLTDQKGNNLITSDEWLDVIPVGTDVLRIETIEGTKYYNTTNHAWIWE